MPQKKIGSRSSFSLSEMADSRPADSRPTEQQHLETTIDSSTHSRILENIAQKGTNSQFSRRFRSKSCDVVIKPYNSSPNLVQRFGSDSGGVDAQVPVTPSPFSISPSDDVSHLFDNSTSKNSSHETRRVTAATIYNEPSPNQKNTLIGVQRWQKAKMHHHPSTNAAQFNKNINQEAPPDVDELLFNSSFRNLPSRHINRSSASYQLTMPDSPSSSVSSDFEPDNSRRKYKERTPDFVALQELLGLFQLKVSPLREMQILGTVPFAATAAAASGGNNVSRNVAAKVDQMQRKQDLLKHVISSGALTLITPKQVVRVQAGEEVSIIVVLRLANVDTDQVKGSGQTTASTVDRNINIRLLGMKPSSLPFGLSQLVARQRSHSPLPREKGAAGRYSNPDIPQVRQALQVRSLLIRAKAFRSEMFVVQKNINFGRVAVMDYATRSVFVENRASVPLLYTIAKSGSICSGFLQIPQGGSGVVPPHGSVEIQFVFRPGLAGHFEEMLSIINVCDSKNTQIITIKARVFQPEPFALVDPPPQLSFGPCLVGKLDSSVTIAVRLSNTTNRRRYLVVQGVDSYDTAAAAAVEGNGDGTITPYLSDSGHHLLPQPSYPCPFLPIFTFVVEVQSNQAGIPREERQQMEDKLELYLFKLRIAERKGKIAKVSKLRSKVDRLVRRLNGEDLGQAGDDASESESDSDADITRIKGNNPSSSDHSSGVSNMATFVLEPACIVSICVSLAFITGRSGLAGWSGSIPFNGAVLFYESRNKDVVKELHCSASVISSTIEYRQALFAPETPLSSLPLVASVEGELHAGEAFPVNEEQHDRSNREDSESSVAAAASSQSSGIIFSGNHPESSSMTSITTHSEDQPLPRASLLSPRGGSTSSPLPPHTTHDATIELNNTFLVIIPQYCLVERDLFLKCSSLNIDNCYGVTETHGTGIRISATTLDMGSTAIPPSFTVHSTLDVDTRVELRWLADVDCEGQTIGLRVGGLKTGMKKPTIPAVARGGQGHHKKKVVYKGENGENVTAAANIEDWPCESIAVLRPNAALEVALSYIGSEENVKKIIKILPRIIGWVQIGALKDNCPDPMVNAYSESGNILEAAPRYHTATKNFKQVTMLPVLLDPPPELWLQAPTRIDLGDVKLGSSVVNSFSIHNANPSAPLKYVVMCENASSEFNPVSLIDTSSGELAPGSTDSVTLHALGTKVGRASREVVICILSDRREKIRIRITFTVKPIVYLVFPDCPNDEDDRTKQMDVGNCYVSRFIDDGHDIQPILRPLRVRNISDRQIFLTVVSNLRKQCYVYSNSSAHKGTEVWEYSFPPKTEVVFYLGLRPVLPLEARIAGDTRELNGGLRFLGFSKSLQQLQLEMEDDHAERAESAMDTASSHPEKGGEKTAADQFENITTTIHQSSRYSEGGGNVEDDAIHLERIETGLLEHKLFECSIRYMSIVGSSMLQLNPTEFPPANIVILPNHSSSSRPSILLNADAALKLFGSETATMGSAGWEGITILHGSFSVVNGSRGLPLCYEFPESQCCATALDEALQAIRMGMLTIRNSSPETAVAVVAGGAVSQPQPPPLSDESNLVTTSFARLFILGSRVGDLPPLSTAVISFVVILRQWWGLFESAVQVVSQDDPAQMQSMQIQLMVQDGTVSIISRSAADDNHHVNIQDGLPPSPATVAVAPAPANRFLDSLGSYIPSPPTINLLCPVCIGRKGTENDCDDGKLLPFRVISENAWECFLEKNGGGCSATSCAIALHNNICVSGDAPPLYAYSNLPVSIQLLAENNTECSSAAIAAAADSMADVLRGDHNCFMRRCSGPLLLLSSTLSTLDMKMVFPSGGSTAPLSLEAVQQGQAIPFEGCVAFASPDGSVKALLRVAGRYCRPQISIISQQFSFDPPVIQLGVVGHSYLSPASIPIRFQIENRCDIRVPIALPGGPVTLVPVNDSLQPQISGLFLPTMTSLVWLEPMSTSDVDLCIELCIEGDTEVWVGQYSLSFSLRTLNEVLCSIGGRDEEVVGVGGELVIHASVSIVTQLLQISRGVTKCFEPFEHYEMVIDAIDIPSPPRTPPVQAAFTVENVYSEPIYITLEVTSLCGSTGTGAGVNEEMEVVELEALRAVLSSLSTASRPLPRDESNMKVLVRPGEVTGVLVVARAKPGARLSERCARRLNCDCVSSSSSQTAAAAAAVKVGEVLLSCSFATMSKDGGGAAPPDVRDGIDESEGGGERSEGYITTNSTRVILAEKVEVYSSLRLGPFLNLSSTDIELLLPTIDETTYLSSQFPSICVPSCFSVENFNPFNEVRFAITVVEEDGGGNIKSGGGGGGDAFTLDFDINPTHGIVKPLRCTVVTLQLTKDCCDAFRKHKNAQLQKTKTSGRNQPELQRLGCYILLLSDEGFPHYPFLKVRVTPTTPKLLLPLLSSLGRGRGRRRKGELNPSGVDEVIDDRNDAAPIASRQLTNSSECGFIEEDQHHRNHDRHNDSSSRSLLPVLDLGGCTPASRDASIFDINLGQQVVQPDGYCGQWELSLIAPPSNMGNVTFKLRLLHDSDAEWLTLGTNSGVLVPGEQANSTLFLEQSRIGVFDTYLTCSNIENPEDLKVIRVRMQVILDGVKSSAIGRVGTFNASSLFRVSVSSHITKKLDILPTVDFGELVVGYMHCERSFLIQNLSPIPLEFHLSSTLPPSLLNFSMKGRNFLNSNFAVVIPSESCESVYLRLQSYKKEDIDARVFVTCRLIKDFQLAVRIFASFIMPQLSVCAISDYHDGGGSDVEEENVKDAVYCEMGNVGAATAAAAAATQRLETTLRWVDGCCNSITPDSDVTVATREKKKHVIVTNMSNHSNVTCFFRCLTKRFVVQLEKPPSPSIPHDNQIENRVSSFIGLGCCEFESEDDDHPSFCLLPGEKAVLHINPNVNELELSDELGNVSNDQGNGGGAASRRSNGCVEETIYLYNALQPTEKHKIFLRIDSGGGATPTLGDPLLLRSPLNQKFLFHGLPTSHCTAGFTNSTFRYVEMAVTKFIRLYDTTVMHFLTAIIFRDNKSTTASSLQSTKSRDRVSPPPSGGSSNSSSIVTSEDRSTYDHGRSLQVNLSYIQLEILTDMLNNGGSRSNTNFIGGEGFHLSSPVKEEDYNNIPGDDDQGGRRIDAVEEQCDKLAFDLIFLTDVLLNVMFAGHSFSCGSASNLLLPCPIVNLASLLYSLVLRHPICSAYIYQYQM